tara:strand:+ start:64402 stop:64752 length:351 start_codon:yes stop_codon:yes gene_type:complete
MLEEAKQNCDHLIVGVHSDPSIFNPNKNKPVQSLIERQIQVRACKYVDEIIVYQTEEDLETILKTLPIDVRFLGQDYKGKPFTGESVCAAKNIQIYYNSRVHDFSSSGLRERIKNE